MNFTLYKNEDTKPVKAWVNGVNIEDEALEQILNVASLPFIHSHVALMPDVHAGKGSTIGSVIPTYQAIIPATIGVDIGCGMVALKTALTASDLPDNLSAVRSEIESKVPHGRTDNGGVNDRGAWHNIPEFNQSILYEYALLRGELDAVEYKHKELSKAIERSIHHLGTLGSGNHFVEVCLDENQDVWIMLHSGSRGLGNKIGTYFIEKAKEEMRRFFINLPDTDLAYLPQGSKYFDDYVKALHLAQKFASLNRKTMMMNTVNAIEQVLDRSIMSSSSQLETAINCHHNYVSVEKHFGKEVFVTRKGAVSAKEGEMGIIPGSMGAKSFIVRGKGNRESFCSCSHGAGRKMSRTKAREIFTVEDHIHATEGVECRKDVDVIDETPMAYKDIDAVMAAQSDLVEVVHTLKQVLCVKG